MKAIISNKEIRIENPSSTVLEHLRVLLSYEDKAKKYQLRRMSKNPFQRSSPAYKKLQAEVNGSLLHIALNGDAVMSSGFYNLIAPLVSNIIDNRCSTGVKIAYPWVDKPYSLRDYQTEAVSLMVANHRGLINFATGLGKTLTAVYAVREIGRKTLIIAPSKSIARQFQDVMIKAFGKARVGFYGDGSKKINDITIGIATSVNNDIDKFKAIDLGLIIVDETHRIACDTFFSIATQLGHVGKLFGLTATDYRSDGKDIFITAGCGDVLIRRDMVWGVANKWLAEPFFIVRKVETDGRNFKDDKLKNYKEHVLNSVVMKKRIEDDAKKFLAAGKSVLVLVDEVAHGAELSKALGLPFATGDDKNSEEYVKQLNLNQIKGLVGTDSKLGEGTDTVRVDVLILANFIASKGPVIQALGRGLRPYPGKTACIVLDYIPLGSEMLTRHAHQRLGYYKEISNKIKVVGDET
jgi:superfamily II DNA or RNA helicase